MVGQVVTVTVKATATLTQPVVVGGAEEIATGLGCRHEPGPPDPILVGPDRWRERSRFFDGIASAMADQWGALGPYQPQAVTPRLEQLSLF